MTLLVHSY